MLTTTASQFRLARQRGCAVGAFNIFNLESAQAVVAAAESHRAPVILQINSGAAAHGGWPTLAALALALAKESSVKISLHLDHGRDLTTVKQALRLGFTSIMIDGSALPFGGNIRLTRQVIRCCKSRRIPVEAELGEIGGVEDDIGGKAGPAYTDPQAAADFIKATGCSSFAPAIGNAHGIYPASPRLDFKRLELIRQQAGVPLVLHGGSGLSCKAIRRAMACGVRKVNFSTELRGAFAGGLRDASQGKQRSVDPRTTLGLARDRVQRVVSNRLGHLGWERNP